MIRIIIFFLFLLISSLLFGQSEKQHIAIHTGIGLKDYVEVGQKKSKVIKTLGRPKKYLKFSTGVIAEDSGVQRGKEWTEIRRTKNRYDYGKLGFVVFFSKRKVYDIHFLDKRYKTVEGLSVGDTKEQLINTYKNGYFWEKIQEVLYRHNTKGLEIVLECDRVKEIRVFEPY